MTDKLPPEVRSEAFNAVKDALLGKGEVEPAKSSEFYNYVVSAVAAVLAPEQRALKAENEALSTMLRKMARKLSRYRRLVETPALVRELQLRQADGERDQLKARVAELEEHERERIANAQHQYTEAWNAYQRLLKRMGTAAGVELPDDLRYNKYEKQILAKITDLRAGQPNT